MEVVNFDSMDAFYKFKPAKKQQKKVYIGVIFKNNAVMP